MKERVTVWVDPITAKLLRRIAENTGEKQYAALARIVRLEHKRVARLMAEERFDEIAVLPVEEQQPKRKSK